MARSTFEEFITENKISEVECLVADMSGTARGKILPPKKFMQGQRSRGLRVPEEVFTLTINGRFVSGAQPFPAFQAIIDRELAAPAARR